MAPPSQPPHPPNDPRPDADLLHAYLRGDVRAFEALYARHKDFTARVARRFARDESEAMDVFQEAFARLVEHAPRLRLTGKVSTWLYPVIRNLVAERRRKEGTLRLASADTGETPGRTPPPTTDDAGDLKQRLARLPDDQREVVLLRVVEGLTVEETSLALGIPEGTVKSRLHHALRALQADA